MRVDDHVEAAAYIRLHGDHRTQKILDENLIDRDQYAFEVEERAFFGVFRELGELEILAQEQGFAGGKTGRSRHETLTQQEAKHRDRRESEDRQDNTQKAHPTPRSNNRATTGGERRAYAFGLYSRKRL